MLSRDKLHPIGFMEKNADLDLGKRLKELRGSVSQAEFAKKIGVSLPSYQRYEYGERTPHPHTLSKIARLCDTTIDWLLTGDLNVEKALILLRGEQSLVLQDFVEKEEKILFRELKILIASSKKTVSKEDFEKISKMADDHLLGVLRKHIHASRKETDYLKHIELASPRSPLYSLIRRIEKIYNRGDKAKIDAIKALLDGFEYNIKASQNPIEAQKKTDGE